MINPAYIASANKLLRVIILACYEFSFLAETIVKLGRWAV